MASTLKILIPKEVLDEIARVAPVSKSEFVREAIVEKLRRTHEERLEQQWIKSLQKKSDKEKTDEDWLKAEIDTI